MITAMIFKWFSLWCRWCGHEWGEWAPCGKSGLLALINERKCYRCGTTQGDGIGGINRASFDWWRSPAPTDTVIAESVKNLYIANNAQVIAELQQAARDLYKNPQPGYVIAIPDGVDLGEACRPIPRNAFEIDHDGLTFMVYGTHYEAIPEGELSPPEPASFEVDQIWLGDVEMTRWLAENAPKVIPEIEGRLA
jgi:hypothetical protein